MMDDLRQEAIDELTACESVVLVTSEDQDISIDLAENYVGGEDMEGYMCDYLGNVVYSNEESIVNAIFDYIEGDDGEIVEVQ